MNSFELLLIVVIIFLPLVVGYGRRLGHWTMTKVWLWLGLLPVAGWFVALAIAIGADANSD